MPEPAHSEWSLTGKGVEHGQDGRVPADAPLCRVSFEVARDSERVGVSLQGELDLDAAREIQPDLRRALSRTGDGIDLDLSGLGFCDCSGLNLLLSLRRRALDDGKTVTIGAGSPAVERLLDLTGTRALFPHPNRDDKHMTHPACHDGAPLTDGDQDQHDTDGDQDPHVLVAQLRRAMQTRPTIDLARGILMASFNLTPEAAWEVLVSASQNTNTKLHRLADDLVETIQGNTLPDAVQQQLAAAVAKAHKTAPPAPPAESDQPDRPEAPGADGTETPAATEPVPCAGAPDGTTAPPAT